MKILVLFAISFLATTALHAATEIKSVPAPSIPTRSFDITKFGAVGDGKTMNTAAIAKAIAACKEAGGGSVVVPAGVFLTGPITLVSHLALVVKKGATIQASDKFSDFGLPDPLPTTQDEVSALRKSLHSLINGSDLTDVAIRGEGTIDGTGAPWWARADKSPRPEGVTFIPRPNMIVIRKCARLEVSGVTLRNSPQFHLVPQLCTDVLIDGVKILAPPESHNTDAIDPSNCRNMLIRHVLTDTGDDNIAFKANDNGPTENVTVTDCTFLHGHGVSVGSETSGGVRNILVQRCTFENTGTAIRIKSARDRGGVIEDITYRDITMKNVDAAIYINLFYDDKTQAKNPQPQAVTKTTPMARNILISNITCEGAKSAGEITALPEAPVSGLVLENIRIKAWTGLKIQDARSLQFHDVSIATIPKPPEVESAVVAADGSGDYKTVQEAVSAAPKKNQLEKPFLIHLKPGTYREVVTIPAGKGAIKMEGEDAATTILSFANAASKLDAKGQALGTFHSATVFVESDDFTAENITFENSFGQGSQALAISVGGDRAVFRKCRFLGFQDTVLLRQGRQYFEGCFVAGAVDFIFGAGTAWFERCEIHCTASGSITAASTPREQRYGLVFSHCKITAEPAAKMVLGRPWRPFASVTFLNTQMTDAIQPSGWDNWHNPDNEKTARFAEYQTTGTRSDKRVPWAKNLTDEQARTITRERVLGDWKLDQKP